MWSTIFSLNSLHCSFVSHIRYHFPNGLLCSFYNPLRQVNARGIRVIFNSWILEIACILKCLHDYSKITGYPKDILIQYILRGIGRKCAIAKKNRSAESINLRHFLWLREFDRTSVKLRRLWSVIELAHNWC